MTSGIRITCVQTNPTVGDISGNLDIVRRFRAIYRDKTDLVVFSECFVTGYPLKDLVMRPGFLRDVRTAMGDFAREIRGDGGPAVLVGAPREGSTHPFNSAFLIDVDGTMQVTDKTRLPNDEVYDEKRTFTEGAMPKPLAFRGLRLGILICEDFWHGDVTRSMVEQGADILIVPNGSHFKVGKQATRLKLGRDVVRRHGVPVLYVNQVGGQDEAVFDGGSYAMALDGLVLEQASFAEAAFTIRLVEGAKGVDIATSIEDDRLNESAFCRYPEKLEAMYLASIVGLRDYIAKSGFSSVVIGLSGGFDSAYTAAVAVDALGADNVLLVRLPSELTGSDSMDDAAEVARLLGAQMVTIPIGGIVDATRTALAPLFESLGKSGFDVTEENQQSRARASMVLMSIANKLGRILLTTGNKSEMAVGFATLYGDTDGGFSVLKDVWKTTGYELAVWRNANKPRIGLGPSGTVIPDSIMEKKPTAELADDQTDAAVLGSYWVMDPFLQHLVEEHQTVEMAIVGAQAEARATIAAMDDKWRAIAMVGTEVDGDGLVEISATYASRIARMVRTAQYKRNQSPPGVVLTHRDFGPGWRLPIAGRYTL